MPHRIWLFCSLLVSVFQAQAQFAGLQGIVLDAADFKPVAAASVIAPASKESDLTGPDGSFSFWRTHTDTLHISIRKAGYSDTNFVLKYESGKEYRLYIRKLSQALPDTDNSVPPITNTTWVNNIYQIPLNIKQKGLHAANCSDTFYADYSISVLPGVGTNHKLAANTINKVHFSVLAGVSAGVSDVEISLGANINYGKVQYVQIATLANYAQDQVKGTQISLLLNTNAAKVQGVQIAGVLNLNADSVKGVQISLLGNRNQKSTEGFMIATLYNQSHSFRGLQASAGINKVHYFEGLQAGLINITDSCNGLPIGVFSYVKKGYRSWELATDEKTMTTLAFKSGVDLFHNEFLAGMQWAGSNKLWCMGYGVGGITPFNKQFDFDVNLNMLLLLPVGAPANSLNYTGKLSFSGMYALSKRVQVFAGPALAFTLLNTSDPNYYSYFSQYPLGYMYNETWGSMQFKTWIGIRGGVRFY